MDRPEIADALRCLVDNAELVEAIHRGTERKRDLAEALGVSTQTIYRRTRQLREYRLVEKSSKGYRLTPIGELHARMISDAQDVSERIYAGERLFSDLGGGVSIPHWLLKDAEIIYPTRNKPHEPLERIREKLAETTNLRGVVSTVIPEHITYSAERLAEGSLRAEIVFTPACIDELETEFPTVFARSLGRDSLTLWETARSVEFDLLFCAEQGWVGIRVYDGVGRLSGVVYTESEPAAEWTGGIYRTYRNTARPLSA
ncbi:HTH domain-containing protein [Halalkalicoccus tibetensis]|uniref:HTH domain-containing protein n=1 Tax=Halalkalicoccus tibetensis TaxID=175632 RepID=A0ABD5V3F0_9EURY